MGLLFYPHFSDVKIRQLQQHLPRHKGAVSPAAPGRCRSPSRRCRSNPSLGRDTAGSPPATMGKAVPGSHQWCFYGTASSGGLFKTSYHIYTAYIYIYIYYMHIIYHDILWICISMYMHMYMYMYICVYVIISQLLLVKSSWLYP